MLDKLIKATHRSVPFLKEDYERSHLKFNKPILAAGIDNYGNPLVSKEEWFCQARLFAEDDRFLVENAGQAIAGTIYRGFCLVPRELPDWAIEGTTGSGTVNGQTGSFTLLSAEKTSMPAYWQNFGQIIRIDFVKYEKAV